MYWVSIASTKETRQVAHRAFWQPAYAIAICEWHTRRVWNRPTVQMIEKGRHELRGADAQVATFVVQWLQNL
jgi:hypothetical protein